MGLQARSMSLYAGAIAVAVIGASLVSLPASVAGSVVNALSSGQVLVRNARGSAWNGRADLTVVAGGATLVLPETHWRLRPSRLLVGELAAELRFAGPQLQGTLEAARGFSALRVANADLTFPAAWIIDRIPMVKTWQPQGTLALKGREIELGPQRFAGDAELVWRNASMPRIGPLGEYQIAATPNGNATQLKLFTVQGPLRLDGAGELGPGGTFRMTGTASAAPTERERFAPILALMGAPRGDGTVPFQWPMFGSSPSNPDPAAPQKAGAADHG